MADHVSSYMPTGGAVVTRAADSLKFTLSARPQAMTAYLRFMDNGTRNTAGLILRFGSSDTAADPRLQIDAASTGYRITHDNGTSSVTATTPALGALGDSVELMGTLSAAGAVQLTQSINGGTTAQSAQSGGITLGQTWAASQVWVNDSSGYIGLRNLAVSRGVQSIATMRRLAGVA